ncbi:MAG: signal transduction histidine kinase, partial [Polyangiales bacterium]
MSKEQDVSSDPERLIVPVVGLVGPVVLLYFAGFQAFIYDNVPAATLLVCVGLACAFTPRVHRTGRSGLRFLSSLIVLGVAGTAYLRGGIILGVLGWLLFPPFVFVLAFRINEAAIWFVICAASVGVIFGLEQFGLTPPRIESTSTGMLGGAIAAVVGLTGIVFAQACSRQTDGRQRVLMERRLFRANKLESIARLAGGIAHDFNNLLTVINNHAQILAEKRPDEDVEAIQHATAVGTALTRRLLSIGRERVATKELEAIDLNGVGAKVSSLLQTLLPSGVRLVFKAARSPAVTRADPWDIHQVLMNLVINARDALQNGGTIELSISFATPTEDSPLRFGILRPGPYVVLKVKDTGVGMSEAVMNKVVEPFFTTRGQKGGTGLGLSIAYGVTRALDGHIDIESVVHEG